MIKKIHTSELNNDEKLTSSGDGSENNVSTEVEI